MVTLSGTRLSTDVTGPARATTGLVISPAVTPVAQGVLLVALTATVGVRPAGWLAGMAFAVVLWRLLATALQRSGRHRLGPADMVTLARAVLIGGVTALAADSLTRPVDVPVLVTLTVIALLLDAVDGQVARRSRTASAFGARFDLEVDAFLLLVLSLLLVEPLGWWALAVGAMRYCFVALGLALPWLTAALPPRFSRKVVAAVQGVVLVVAVAGVLPQGAAAAAVGAALTALCWSFGRDARWLHRVRVVIRTR